MFLKAACRRRDRRRMGRRDMKMRTRQPSQSATAGTDAGSLRVPGRPKRARRPDVGGYFALTLVSTLTSLFFITGDLIRLQVPLSQSVPFALHHPMSHLLAFCTALLALLLTIGDV
jgi:hypothetical protein